MTIPRHQKFRLPLLKVLGDGESRTIRECVFLISDMLGLSEEDRNELLPKSKRKRVYDKTYWAKKHTREAGLIHSVDHGKIRISEEGKRVLTLGLEEIDDVFLKQYHGFSDFLERSNKKSITHVNSTPNASKEDDKEKNELLMNLQSLSPDVFEDVMLELLFHMGFGVSRDSIKSNPIKIKDGGLDGYIELDPLRIDRIYVQCKRWNDGRVSDREISNFCGSLERVGGTKGVFITTSRFTAPAKIFNEEIKAKQIRLIDGEELTELILKYDFKL